MTQSNIPSPSKPGVIASPFITIIAAVAANDVIGRNNDIPWHIPRDLAYFKQMTLNKPVIMGRKTFEAIGKPLPERTNIVITTDENWAAPDVVTVPSLDAAIGVAAGYTDTEIMIIGGAQVYKEAMPIVDKLHITHIEMDVEGDTFFPTIDNKLWKKASDSGKYFAKSDDKDVAYHFATYIRIKH